MRLRVLDQGHRLRQRIVLTIIRIVSGTEPDPVAKVSLYRPDLFGRQWLRLIESVMRGQSEWSEAEREMLAAFVSRLNGCPFCVGVHREIAGSRLDEQVTADRIDRWRDGGFSPRLTPALELLEKVTLAPADVGPHDIRLARAAGLSDAALSDALHVAFVFNVVNRLANAFDFAWKTDADRIKLARSLDRIAYHVPQRLLR